MLHNNVGRLGVFHDLVNFLNGLHDTAGDLLVPGEFAQLSHPIVGRLAVAQMGREIAGRTA